jgi:sec-independent protein translocase protein TatA
METIFFAFNFGTEWILIGAVLFLLFGASRLPQLAKSLGQSKKAFREGLREAEEEEERADEQKRLNLTSAQLNPTSAQPAVITLSDEELMAEMRRRVETQKS